MTYNRSYENVADVVVRQLVRQTLARLLELSVQLAAGYPSTHYHRAIGCVSRVSQGDFPPSQASWPCPLARLDARLSLESEAMYAGALPLSAANLATWGAMATLNLQSDVPIVHASWAELDFYRQPPPEAVQRRPTVRPHGVAACWVSKSDSMLSDIIYVLMTCAIYIAERVGSCRHRGMRL